MIESETQKEKKRNEEKTIEPKGLIQHHQSD